MSVMHGIEVLPLAEHIRTVLAGPRLQFTRTSIAGPSTSHHSAFGIGDDDSNHNDTTDTTSEPAAVTGATCFAVLLAQSMPEEKFKNNKHNNCLVIVVSV